MTTARRLALLTALAIVAVVPAIGASAQQDPGVPVPVPDARETTAPDPVTDDLLQIAVNRLHDEAREFFGGDYWSLSVVRLSDGHLASANGDERHVSLSAAKAVWVAIAMAEFGADAVEPYVKDIFVKSSNGDASRVLNLWVDDPESANNHEGVDAVNSAMWSWGFPTSYLYAWFSPSGGSYGYHISSTQKPGFPNNCCVKVWSTANFMSTDDLATFWKMAAAGEIMDVADTAQFLEWASLPRVEGSGMITTRLPAAVADQVPHKAGWNSAHTRRIDGGVVTTPGGEQFAIAISFRLNEYQTGYWQTKAPDWGRYATCEIYALMAGSGHECTRTVDPYEIVNHTTAPIGSLSSASADRAQLQVNGWALDRDLGADPVDVRITADGTTVGTLAANQLKTSVEDLHGLGNYHGFSGTFDVGLSPGNHQVCAVAINDSSKGVNRTIGCTTVAVPADYLPTGNLTDVVVRKDLIVAWGWAKDLDTGGPIEVKITLDGGKLRLIDADRGAGGHGFKMRLAWPLSAGNHEVCAIAQNFEDGGPHQTVGCKTVTVPEDWPPAGSLANSTADATSVWVKGRAWDSDTSDPIEVRVEVDGTIVGSVFANQGAANRKYNDTVLTAMTPGAHTVCTIAVNHTGDEPTTVLGCTTVVVETG